MVVGNIVKFQKFDKVKVKNQSAETHSGRITQCNESAFGETYWILWSDGTETLMHGDNLEIDNATMKH